MGVFQQALTLTLRPLEDYIWVTGKEINLRSFAMAYRITDSCAACGTCAGECPTEAITEGDIYVIDQDKCAECGTCASVCPVGAIVEE